MPSPNEFVVFGVQARTRPIDVLIQLDQEISLDLNVLLEAFDKD